jgi:16S rRNA (cytosine967-C5)-methyltransferase
MRLSGRVAAAIAVIEDFERRRVPLKMALADWARNARFAGAKDRAFIAGLALDVLRRRRSLAAAMEDDTPRAATLAALRFVWGKSVDEIAETTAEAPHGPGALTDGERAQLARPDAPSIRDHPEWLEPAVRRAFGDAADAEMAAFAARADVDLRLNTLATTPEKALDALKTVGAAAHPFVVSAARIEAPDAVDRTPAVTIIPAFNKGWVEVQDLGSQIAALAAGDVKGRQVLDLCAGGGGKTLALAALMENSGQLYAYDDDARRLQPLYERARRAGVRNLQIINPVTDKGALYALAGKIDVVFVDAPCTGSGTWRRRPDTKWRLTPDQLKRRMAEQDKVLRAGASFVKPGGRMIYVTCSFLVEENEDRLAAFLAEQPGFAMTPAINQIKASGMMTDTGLAAIAKGETADGALRLTPARVNCDAFYIAVLRLSA